MHAHANSIRDVPPAHSFPPINPALLPLSLFILFHPSLFSSTFCCVLFVIRTHYQKFSPFSKLKKSFVRNILKFAVWISCLPLLYQIHWHFLSTLGIPGNLFLPPTPWAFGVCLLVTSDKQLLPSTCYKDSQLALALLPVFRPRWSPMSTSSMEGFDEKTDCSSDQIHGDLIVYCFMRKNWARMPR